MPPESGSAETVDQGKVVAVDLNGTLATGRGPDPSFWGNPTEGAVAAMQSLKDRGYLVCINSVVGDRDAIRGWLTEHGIPFDHVNESPAQPDGSSDKLNAAAYLDDRAIPFRGDWKETMNDLFSSGVLEKRVKIVATKSAIDDAIKRLPPHMANGSQVESWANDQWFNQSSAQREFKDRKQFARDVRSAWETRGKSIHKHAKWQYLQGDDDVIGPFDTQEEAVKVAHELV